MENEVEEGSDSEWSELTRECLINILSRLTVDDLWRGTMLVCKSWFSAFKEPSLHSVFNLDPLFDSPRELPRWWSPEFEAKIDSMLRSVVQWTHIFLTQIRIRHCSDRSLALVAERCPNLEVLSIRSCPHVTDDSISRIAVNCPKLRELDISYCYDVTHKSLALIGRNCPNLKVLKRNLMN
uniref:Uncharacterized protein n=2 Tax=Lotus japonicus TaxID=34305 RepID=I3SQF2_LOTJA|nr:unknown [Lotus japonicus]